MFPSDGRKMPTSETVADGPLRCESWKGILDIVESVRRMKIGGVTEPLVVDATIRPNLPTSQQCVKILASKTSRIIPLALMEILQQRVDQLREQTLLSYSESILKMASAGKFTGLNDSEFQRSHCRSIEIWFNRAIEELFTTFTVHLKVRPQVSPAATSISTN